MSEKTPIITGHLEKERGVYDPKDGGPKVSYTALYFVYKDPSTGNEVRIRVKAPQDKQLAEMLAVDVTPE